MAIIGDELTAPGTMAYNRSGTQSDANQPVMANSRGGPDTGGIDPAPTPAPANNSTGSAATNRSGSNGTFNMPTNQPSDAERMAKPGVVNTDAMNETGGTGIIISGQKKPGSQPETGGTDPEPTGGIKPAERVSPNEVITPAQREASRVAARLGEVTADQTVQAQLERITGKDSALLQQARGRAMKEANRRGLINSSMAAQAGEEAVISQALPIASQDAATYRAQAAQNQDSENQFLMTDKNFENAQSLQDKGFEQNRALQSEGANQRLKEGEQNFNYQREMFDRTAAFQSRQLDKELQNRLATAGISANAAVQSASISAQASMENARLARETQRDLATMDAQLRRELQTSDQTFRSTQGALDREANRENHMTSLRQSTLTSYSSAITAISTADMEPEDKDRALANVASLYHASGYMPVSIDLNALIRPRTSTTGSGTGTQGPNVPTGPYSGG